MSTIIEALNAKTSLLAGKGVSPEQIAQAEQELGLSFSEEYCEYLSTYGIAAFDGRELTGITKSKRLNVVFATLEVRKDYPEMPADLYVLEETGVEEIIILQDSTGAVYRCAPNAKLRKISESLTDYVSMKQ